MTRVVTAQRAARHGSPALKRTWVRVPALMPLANTRLQDYIQALDEDKFQEVQARVAEYLGLLDDAD